MSAGSHRLLRASAGTGKTYQLVQAYLSAVREHGLRPGQVVAITFTRKAALELRSRIRRGLAAAGCSRSVLAEVNEAPISSFHGLSLQLLRGLGLGAGLAEGVEVLGDAGDDRLLFADACEEAWLAGDAATTAAVQALAPHLAIDRGLAPALWDTLGRAREDSLAIDGGALLGAYLPEQERCELHQEACALRDRLAAVRTQLTATGRARIDAFLAEPLPDPGADLDSWATGWSRAARHLDRRGKLREHISAGDLALLRERVHEPRAAAECGRLAAHLATLIDAAWRAYARAKQVARAVDFGDLVERLVQVLATDAEAHRAVRRRFSAVLVDEAQDTNRTQRRLVRLLAGIEGPAARDGEPAALFVVGDRKQSIYTFRGADPEAFEAFAGDVSALGGSEEVLTESRRSTPELVAAVNSLGLCLFGEGYEPLAPLDPAQGGRPTLGRPAMTWLETPDGAGVAAVVREAGAVAAFVRERVEAGGAAGDVAVLLAAMSRAPLFAGALAEQGIAAVLGGGGGLYAQHEIADLVALLAWLTDRTDRLSAAIALRSPLFGLSESGLLELLSPERGSGDALSRLRKGQGPVPETGVDTDRRVLESARDVLGELVAAAEVMGAAAMIEHVDRLLDVRAVYLGLDGGEQRVANIDRLWELAEQLDRSGRGGVARFAREQLDHIWRRHAEPMMSLAGGRRAVSIGTIHQAKGLEFPVVLLPDLRHRARGERGPLRYERSQGLVFCPTLAGASMKSRRFRLAGERLSEDAVAEQRRLLYVAVTRAQQEVVLVGSTGPKARQDRFGKLLDPWRPIAEEEGLLVRRAAPEPPAPRDPQPQAEPSSLDRAWADDLVARCVPPAAPAGSRILLPVTTLETYLQCPRRGLFVHALRLPEPGWVEAPRSAADDDRDPPLDPLARGRLAHAVLAAIDRCEGASEAGSFVDGELERYGFDPGDSRLAGLREDVLAFMRSPPGVRLLALTASQKRHELPFRLAVPAGPHVAELSGQIDLLYWDEGPVVVDYKHARASGPGLAAYEVQLDAYALAVERLCGVEGDIPAELVFLRDRSPPARRVVTASMRRRLEQRIAEVVEQLTSLQGRDLPWPGRPPETCMRMQCGFARRCHPATATGPAPEAPARRGAQLSLFAEES